MLLSGQSAFSGAATSWAKRNKCHFSTKLQVQQFGGDVGGYVGVQRCGIPRNRHATATVVLAVCSTIGFGFQASSGADKQHGDRELAAFRLSMEKLRQAAQPGKALEKLAETDPSLRSATQFAKQTGRVSVNEKVSRIDDH